MEMIGKAHETTVSDTTITWGKWATAIRSCSFMASRIRTAHGEG